MAAGCCCAGWAVRCSVNKLHVITAQQRERERQSQRKGVTLRCCRATGSKHIFTATPPAQHTLPSFEDEPNQHTHAPSMSSPLSTVCSCGRVVRCGAHSCSFSTLPPSAQTRSLGARSSNNSRMLTGPSNTMWTCLPLRSSGLRLPCSCGRPFHPTTLRQRNTNTRKHVGRRPCAHQAPVTRPPLRPRPHCTRDQTLAS